MSTLQSKNKTSFILSQDAIIWNSFDVLMLNRIEIECLKKLWNIFNIRYKRSTWQQVLCLFNAIRDFTRKVWKDCQTTVQNLLSFNFIYFWYKQFEFTKFNCIENVILYMQDMNWNLWRVPIEIEVLSQKQRLSKVITQVLSWSSSQAW